MPGLKISSNSSNDGEEEEREMHQRRVREATFLQNVHDMMARFNAGATAGEAFAASSTIAATTSAAAPIDQPPPFSAPKLTTVSKDLDSEDEAIPRYLFDAATVTAPFRPDRSQTTRTYRLHTQRTCMLAPDPMSIVLETAQSGTPLAVEPICQRGREAWSCRSGVSPEQPCTAS